MAMRITGMISGLDTDSMVKELTSAYETKKDNIWKSQKKLSYKQEVWSEMNSKIYDFYTKELFNAKMTSSYQSSEITAADNNIATVKSNNNITGIQELNVKQLASQTFITGNKMAGTTAGRDGIITITTKGGVKQSVTITKDMSGLDVAKALNETGINSNFDSTYNVLFLNSISSGVQSDFNIGGDPELLEALGLGPSATKKIGKDAIIELNDAEFTFEENSFTINSLSIDLKNTGITTIGSKKDSDLVFNTISNFVNSYNELLVKMNTAYNADKSDLLPMTDDERNEVSETVANKWEQNIKDSILRKDTTLGNIISVFKTSIINNKLSQLGITTEGYFTSDKNRRGCLKLDENKLKAAITADPNKVIETFSSVASELYNKITDKMKSTSLNSAYVIYNDKVIKEQYTKYEKDLANWDKKIEAIQDKYYKQFSTMETMLSKLQSQSDYIGTIFGGKS